MKLLKTFIQMKKNSQSSEDYENLNKAIAPHLNNKEELILLLENNLTSLYYANKTFASDRDVVIAAVKKSGLEMSYVDAKFYDDKDIVLLALKTGQVSEIMKLVSPRLKDDDDVALLALKKDVFSLKYLSHKYQDNKELILSKKLFDLEGVSERLKADREVVLMSVSLVGENLKYASSKLQDDAEIVLNAVKNSACETAFKYASERLRGNETIAKAAIKNFWDACQYLSPEGRNNKEIMLYVLKKDGSYFNLASDALKRDKKVILTALMNTLEGNVINYLDKDIQLALGTQNPIEYFDNKKLKFK